MTFHYIYRVKVEPGQLWYTQDDDLPDDDEDIEKALRTRTPEYFVHPHLVIEHERQLLLLELKPSLCRQGTTKHSGYRSRAYPLNEVHDVLTCKRTFYESMEDCIRLAIIEREQARHTRQGTHLTVFTKWFADKCEERGRSSGCETDCSTGSAKG